jgi:hypothetical protein
VTDETRPKPLTMPAWLSALERLITAAEGLADSTDEDARNVAQVARHVRVRRPKGM